FWTQSYDAVITQQAKLLGEFPDSKRIWWTHLYSSEKIIQEHVLYARHFAHKIVVLSKAHQADFENELNLQATPIRCGLWLEEIEKNETRDPYKLLYAS